MKFDSYRLLKDYYMFAAISNRQTPINLRKPVAMTDDQGLDYGADTLYDYQQQKYTKRQQDYHTNMDFIADTYTEQVIDVMRMYIKQDYDLNVGRIRLLALRPKECLTMHTDRESETRFHIPIMTNTGALFIVDNKVVTMHEQGNVYQLDVQKPHTAINASREKRVHMVFDAYSN